MSKTPGICAELHQRTLLVEGADDCHATISLCIAHSVPKLFGIYDCGNDAGVLKQLNAMILQPDTPEVLGVVLDADARGVSSRWDQVRRKLEGHEYNFPDKPDINGEIIMAPEGRPKLGFWLMPNNVDAGMLEDLCLTMISEEARAYAEQCVEGAKERGFATYKDVHKSKALLHAHLAWQDSPGAPIGLAIRGSGLASQVQPAKAYVEWLRKLFT